MKFKVYIRTILKQVFLLLLTVTVFLSTACQKNSAKQSALDETLTELVGSLRLLNREYAAANRDGKVVDAFEYEEAAMALRQALRLWKKVESAFEKPDQGVAREIDTKLQDLKTKVEAKSDAQAVSVALVWIIPQLESKISGGSSPLSKMTAASVRAADADIQGELVVDQYRLGIATFAPKPFFIKGKSGILEMIPPPRSTHFLAVVVREKGTKRALASTHVSARIVGQPGKPIELLEIWGDYSLYGANVMLPEGSFTLGVSVEEPPMICRHGDALAAFMAPAYVEFKMIRKGMEITVDAPKPQPVIADYRIGEDVEEGLAASIVVKEAGDYKIGFIAEGPEPIWIWKEQKLEPRAVEKTDTHHLEILLLEKNSNRIVNGAQVHLSLENQNTKKTEQVEMHNLLSSFAHYGETLKLDPGPYHVQVRIDPPSFGQFDTGKFESPVTVAFDWNGKRKSE